MEQTRRTWMAVFFYGHIATILLLQPVQHVASVFLTNLKCTAGTDGQSVDAPCKIEAYLGSMVTLDCAGASYTSMEPTDFMTAQTGKFCTKKLEVSPAKCADGDTQTYNAAGLGSMTINSQVLIVPFTRNVEHKSTVTVYARCSKSDKEAMYIEMKIHARPKFPDVGRIVSCMVPVTTAGKTCDLSANFYDYAVFDCPMKGPEVVPAQTSDRPHVCPTALKEPDSTCSGASTDLGADGLTLVSLKDGATLKSFTFKVPDKSSAGKEKAEGYVNCKGTDETRFYKFTVNFKASTYKMPQTFKICDPADGAKQGAPCSVELKANESYLINCGGLKEMAPADLMKSTGAYCTRPVQVHPTDLCSDATAKWADIGAEVIESAGSLVLTHKKADLAKTMTAYGKCFEGPNAVYFKVMFKGAAATEEKPTESHGAGLSCELAVAVGVLGTVLLASDAASKIF